ncbi:MAG: N-acetylmuramoyl-L-alanine amidase, partial [Sphingobium sp.]
WTGPRPSWHNGVMTAALFLFATLFAPTAEAARVQSIAVDGDAVVLSFDEAIERASTFALDGPRRLAVDIPGVEPGSVSTAGGPIEQVRQGRQNGDTARIVLDLASPTLISDARFGSDGRTLTLSLKSVEQSEFTRAARAGRSRWEVEGTQLAMNTPPKRRYSVTIPLDPPKRLSLPRIQGPDGRPLVVIDAGHGGHDPGAISPHGGAREKDATLAIARAIRDELVSSGRVRVALTREDDRFIVLNQRYEIARRLNADLFISIHADSAGNEQATGATVYTLSEVASDREAARLAARENKADILNGVNLGGATSDVSSILIDLTQRETMNISSKFATLLKREAAPLVPFRSDYHRFASLIVLKAPDVPSVLFETGYLSNEADMKFLFSTDGRKRIATGAARAIETHFARQLASR